MKVIIIKKCKDGDVNQLLDVSNGYASNFLIKQGFALPYNKKTAHLLKQKLHQVAVDQAKHLQEIEQIKQQIEHLELRFELKMTKDVVHGSITRKQILNSLRDQKINLESHQVDNVRIDVIGVTKVKITLDKNAMA